MKLKSLFLFFALMMGGATIANAQKDRMVFWVHGLGGDGSSWQKAAEATQLGSVSGFGLTKIVSAQLSYSEFNNAISTASLKLDQDIITTWNGLKSQHSGITDKTKNFIIAHSQGGIVSRYMDKLYQNPQNGLGDRNFGGIVTFGTPHQGAIALNNTPMLLQLIGEGCADLLAGPIDEEIPNNFPLSLITFGFNVRTVLEPACNLVQDKIVPILASDFTSPINQDYKVGAAVINEINGANAQTGTRKVAFYGIEDDPILWRMLFSLRERPPNLFPAFEADADSRLIGEVNGNLLKYEMKTRQHQEAASALPYNYCSGIEWTLLPVICAGREYLSNQHNRQRNLQGSWSRGANWWRNANNRYKAAVGAAEVVGTYSTAYECDCTSYDGNGNQGGSWSSVASTPQECYSQGSYDQGSGAYTNCYLGTPTTIVTYSVVDVPSDGLVLASSASGYPGAATKEMIGSNHQQMRNDTNTKARLNELYNGIHGDYFYSR